MVLLLQGIADTLRCILCLKSGAWPARLHDVEEMETILTEQHQRELAEQQRSQAAGQEDVGLEEGPK